MSDDERAAMRNGLAEADQGKFVSDEVVAEASRRQRKAKRERIFKEAISQNLYRVFRS
jgi:predicted transcriptional regulator